MALVALVAIAPSIGTLGAGLISDDGAALGYVHRMGPFADWLRPEYDVHTFRFWRPLVTVSLGLQESLTGIAPLPLRAFNLLGHIATALLILQLGRQLGARNLPAAAVACLVALFPYQGGTVTWIVGRVDSQCVPLALAALVATLAGRSFWAGLFFFLALATKEVAVAVPFAAVCLVWMRARGARASLDSPPSAKSSLVVLGCVLVLTVVLRRYAIGTWGGGYPGGIGATFPDGVGVSALVSMAKAAGTPLLWLLVGLGVALVLVAVSRRGASDEDAGGSPWALYFGALLCGAFALAPLVRSLVPGDIGAQHERTLMLADALLCLGFLALFVGRRQRWVEVAGVVLVLGLLGQRGWAAWQDTHEWAMAGDMAEELVTYTHATLTDPALGVEPSSLPVLSATPPGTLGGAYVLQWGVADRFRAPFPETPRPVWPWRAVFDGPEMARTSVTRPEHNLRWSFGRGQRMVPPLLVTRGEVGREGEFPGDLHLSAELFTEPGPLLTCGGEFPGARFEALLFTELGYGIGLFGGPKQRGEMHAIEEGPVPLPFGGTIALRDLLMLEPEGTGTGGVQLWEVLALAADFGARDAYLELRAVDDARGKLDRPVGASAWIHLTWGPELREAVKPFDGFR